MNELLRKSAAELARLIRWREVSSTEVVDAHVRRIEAVNGALNAVAVERFDHARAEARAADAVLATTDDLATLGALHGVPCTIKDFIAVSGMPQTGGLVSRAAHLATEDATVVRRLREAGAIVMGITNVPEGGMWMETHNHVYGRTNNPWDLSRTPGGSSGGEAAIIAAGGSPFGIGSDIAGSVRIPAAFCGIVSHKPTGKMVPNTGHWGAEGLPAGPYLTCGPMARHVEDLELLLPLIAGPDGLDPLIEPWPSAEPVPDLKDVTVIPVTDVPGVRVRPAMRAAVERAAELLGQCGATVRPLRSKKLRAAFPVWASAMSEGGRSGKDFATVLAEGGELSVGAELLRSLVGRSDFTFPALALAAVEKLATVVPDAWANKIPGPEPLRAELEEELGDRAVLLYPPYTRPAPRHRQPLLTPVDFICTGIFSVLGFPVSVVPVGREGGLPTATQIVGGRGRDTLTLAVARALETALPPWQPAPVIAP